MELRHLRYFVMVAEERNVSRAAARLHVTQPAISRQIKELEQELGVVLFERMRAGMDLTEAGKLLLGHAREILKRSLQAADEVRAHSGSSRPLIVGYVASAPSSFLGSVLRGLAKLHPEIEVELREMQPGDQIEALARGELDAALIGEPCDEIREKFAVRVVRRLPVSAVLPDDHAMAGRKAIELSALAGNPFVGLAPRHFPGRNGFLRNACRQAGFEPSLRVNAQSLSAALGMVAAGRGVTLMPADTASLPHPGAVFRKIASPKLSVNSAAAWRRGQESRALALFLDALCGEAEA